MACGGGCCGPRTNGLQPKLSQEQGSESSASNGNTGAPHPSSDSESTVEPKNFADELSLSTDRNADSTSPQQASQPATFTPRHPLIDFKHNANEKARIQQSCCSTAAASACATSARVAGNEAKKPTTSCATSACCTSKDATASQSAKSKFDVDCAASCCETKSVSSGCGDDCCVEQEIDCEDDCCGQEDNVNEDDCCGKEVEKCKDDCYVEEEESCANDCCEQDAIVGKSENCCSDQTSGKGCCTADKKAVLVHAIETIPSGSRELDLEKGITSKEHIILSVSGMTCTGCETKLQRVLGTLDYISNLRTSLILARAEMDIADSAATVDDVIKHLHRTTEFKCERVSNQGISLDLICSGEPIDVVKGEWPEGVLEITAVDKTTIRVAFDAKVVGARDLLDQQWAQSLQLAPPRSDASLDAGSRHVRQMGLMTLLSAILTIPVLVLAWAPLPEREVAYGSASLALATIVQICIAGPFYPKAIKALVFSKVIEMDLLIVLSTSAAYIFSVVSFGYLVAGQPLSTGEFFETSTLLVTLIMVGRWVASLARQKAAESISIRALQTHTAVLIPPKGGEKEIDARLLQFGDIFKVAPDTRIPTDGTVVSGASEVDESMLTGESVPIEKHPGSSVIAGSINGMGTLTIRLTRLPGDNTITTIASMVDETKLSKPKIQDIADKVASYFVPVVVALTIITFTIWMAIGIAVRGQSGSEAAINAITYAITVLIVSCPCAIGLAVPMVIVVASGVAAKHGVIFKSANSIEIAYKATDVVFDKTGTLTMGELKVVEETFIGADAQPKKAFLLGMVKGIKHPVSAAVAAHFDWQTVQAVSIKELKAIPGKGVECKLDGKTLRAGNSRWLDVSSQPQVKAMLSKGLTAFCFTVDNELVAVLGLQDTLRPEAQTTVDHLQKQGIRVHILSGDDDGAVQAVGAKLNIPPLAVRSRCSPGDKQAYIKDLIDTKSSGKEKKKHRSVVVFVGDGTNDAVALAQATIGVHMSSGTDIAQSAAEVVLVRSDLSCVLTLMVLSRKAMHRVAFNFGWSFVYNLFAVLLGAGAFVNARIPPEYAGLGELVSVLPVILAAVLLRWSRI